MVSLRKPKSLSILALVITFVIYSVLGFLLSRESPHELDPATAIIVSALPHAIALVNTVALVSLIMGYRAIRSGEIDKHRTYMVIAVILIMAFLSMYVTRISLGGVKEFKGPEIIYLFIYLPLLFIHVVLSIISVPLVVYNILTGLALPVGEISATKHPKVGRAAVWMWSISLALGVIVYLMLNYIH